MGYSSSKAALDQVKSPVISAAKGKMGSDIPETPRGLFVRVFIIERITFIYWPFECTPKA
jgi:hypothetical protein